MSLSAGTRLGPYEIVAPLGAGGMGEVYRARDSKLKRDVALKVLPEAFAADPERMARFQREAEVLASLNHPNIAQIYGVEERALVMELVEGEAPKGPLPFDEAWKIASQIAAALEYAHERGIVHRDLKPANVKITPDGVVKLLDFGLAKAFTPQVAAPGNAENSPTLTLGATQLGVILGTAAYMAPEQAKGKAVDKRADIWSFGVVVYELLTGERLFGGDVSDTLAQVLTKEPDLEKVAAPARRLLRECLEKDPKDRLRDIGDARRLLEVSAEHGSQPRSRDLIWKAAAMALAAVAAVALWAPWRAAKPRELPFMRLNVNLGPDAVPGTRSTVAISADGTRIAFPVIVGGKSMLATRLLNQADATPLPGTENGEDPFFSPDGQWIGFAADGKLKKISVLGGGATTVCDAAGLRGASWGEDGYIVATLAGNVGNGLMRVPDSGGTPELLSKLGNGENFHRWPQILAGGEWVLFTASATAGFNDATIEALSLRTHQVRTLIRGGFYGRYVASSSRGGHLVYVHEGALFAVPLDPQKMEVRGTPTPVLEDIAANTGAGGGQFDVSRTGTLVYLSGKAGSGAIPIVWIDSTGKSTPLGEDSLYWTLRLSPDGRRLAYLMTRNRGADVWVHDLERDTPTQLTFTGPGVREIAWMPDSKHLVYATIEKGGFALMWIRADGSGEPQKLLESSHELRPQSFSPDGRKLAYLEGVNGSDVLAVPLDLSDPEHPKPGKPEPFLATPFGEFDAAFSPDGRWMAYSSDESGSDEVFVRPYPGPGGKWKISLNGGKYATWSRDGHELFYLAAPPDDRVMVVDYTATGNSFSSTRPRVWSPQRILRASVYRPFDLAPDSKRIVVFPQPETAVQKGGLTVTFLFNFPDELERRAPVGAR